MITFLQGDGFLSASASLGADLSLVLTVLAAALLTIGWRLAVRRRYEAHRWVQTAAVCLNAVPVVVWMIRSLAVNILPGIPGNLARGSFALTTIHAAVGLIGVVLGVFVMLRGNGLVPQALRFRDYKPFMRWSYATYMLGTLTGVIAYGLIYGNGT